MLALEPPVDSVQIGILGKTFGLKGGLHFYGLGPAEDAALAQLPRVFVPTWGERRVLDVKTKGNKQVLFLARVEHINIARTLVNQPIYAYLEDLPEPEVSVYADVLLGLEVVVDGEPLGQVSEVQTASSQDLLIISTPTGTEHMLPLQADYVSFDEESGIIYVTDPPEGLFVREADPDTDLDADTA
jgi:16S rRNA processing protein RimM